MLCIIALIAVLVVSNAALAQSFASGSAEKIVSAKVYLSVDKLRPGDDFKLAVRATVKDGYHIGAHDKDSLYPAKLTITAPKGITFSKPAYPKAQRIDPALRAGQETAGLRRHFHHLRGRPR